MTNPATTYQPLGNFIRKVDNRNRDLKVKLPMGINIEKQFMPSVANVIGTDMSSYKLVGKNQFACNLMHVGRDGKIPVSINLNDVDILVSPAYHVFEISDQNTLHPEFLMMWFHRDEFDREASFYTDSDVRCGLDFNTLLEMRIPVPPIAEQRAIVAEYAAVQHRMEVNKRLIAKLEETAQTLYKKMFVDGVDKENLPDGWRMGTLGEVCEISSGKSSIDKVDEKSHDFPYPVAGAAGVIGYSSHYNQDEKIITTGRVGTIGKAIKYKEKIWTSDNVLIMKTKFYEYCYCVLQFVNYEDIMKGGVQNLITQTDLKEVPIIIPPLIALNTFENQASTIFKNVEYKEKENNKLTELQSLLLARMGR